MKMNEKSRYNKFTLRLLFVAFVLSFSFLSLNAQSLAYYQKEAKKGDAVAMMFLGLYNQQGKYGLKKDSIEAFKWFKKSAELGLAESQVMLGNCYRYGQGTEKDSALAYYWYSMATGASSSIGYDAVGDCHYYGIGVERDVVRARYFYGKAAKRGYKKSQLKYDRIRFSKTEDKVIDL